jgi:hypothetical protein
MMYSSNSYLQQQDFFYFHDRAVSVVGIVGWTANKKAALPEK